MPLSDLIERARQGDASAIARLITRSLADQGVVARGHWQDTTLQLTLEGDEPLHQDSTVPIIRRGLRKLQLTCPIDQVEIVSRQVGQPTADWQERFLLSGTGAAGALTPSPVVKSSAATGNLGARHDPAIDEAETLLSDHALVALTQLGPLFGYLTFATNSVIGFPFFWWGGTFLLPWRIVPPLILLLVRGQDSTFVRRQSKNALNFQLAMVIYWIVTIALMFVLIGFLFVIPLAMLEIILTIIAAVKSAEGKPFRYPCAISFIR